MKNLRRLLMVLAVLAVPMTALAHPLGNFTINHHIAISIEESNFSVNYVIDMAEIPAFQELSGLDVNSDGVSSSDELAAYAVEKCKLLGDGLHFARDAVPVDLTSTSSSSVTQPGQNDVPTLRVVCDYESEIGPGELTIENNNFPERIGWSEIIVVSESVPITTDLSSESQSAYLTSYPDGELASTPDVRSGAITIGAGQTVSGAAAPLLALGSAFNAEDMGLLAGVFALGAALLLGATHALAPGHGKTIVAAYLVGTRGTPRQAIVLAGTTAISHTAGVAILGVIAATASVTFEPTVFYPYLSTIAGVVILVVGARLLWIALRRGGHGHQHSHDDGHDHGHGRSHDRVHSHPHVGDNEIVAGSKPTVGWKAVAALGLSGGLVPSASAVVLLLGAIQLGRAWFGVLLVGAFGVGMAAALVGSGLLAVVAHRYGWKWFAGRRPESAVWRWVPATAASAVVVLGLILTIDSVGDLPIL